MPMSVRQGNDHQLRARQALSVALTQPRAPVAHGLPLQTSSDGRAPQQSTGQTHFTQFQACPLPTNLELLSGNFKFTSARKGVEAVPLAPVLA